MSIQHGDVDWIVRSYRLIDSQNEETPRHQKTSADPKAWERLGGYMCIWIYLHMYIYIYLYMCIHLYIHVYICVYTHV